MKAERETVDRLIAHFLADRIGATFEGHISGVTRAGLFVKLDDTGADGFIPARTIGNEYFRYHEDRHALIGEPRGETYRLGDTRDRAAGRGRAGRRRAAIRASREGRYDGRKPAGQRDRKKGTTTDKKEERDRGGKRRGRAARRGADDGKSLPPRDSWSAMLRGWRGRCPNCGEGRMFRAFLKVADHCPACGEALHHQRADDAPAYFVILIVGHIVVPLVLAVETRLRAALLAACRALAAADARLSLALLQPIKGAHRRLAMGAAHARLQSGAGRHDELAPSRVIEPRR